MRRVPSRADIEEDLPLWHAERVALVVELAAVAGRPAEFDQRAAELGDAGCLVGLRRCAAARTCTAVVLWDIGLQLAQERLHGKVQDVRSTAEVLLALAERDVTAPALVLKLSQQPAEIGSVVGRHAEKLMEDPESGAYIDERFAEVLAGVGLVERHDVQHERVRAPLGIDVVGRHAKEVQSVRRRPAVERERYLAGRAAQCLADLLAHGGVAFHDRALDGVGRGDRRERAEQSEQRAKGVRLDRSSGPEVLHHPSDKAPLELLWREGHRVVGSGQDRVQVSTRSSGSGQEEARACTGSRCGETRTTHLVGDLAGRRRGCFLWRWVSMVEVQPPLATSVVPQCMHVTFLEVL